MSKPESAEEIARCIVGSNVGVRPPFNAVVARLKTWADAIRAEEHESTVRTIRAAAMISGAAHHDTDSRALSDLADAFEDSFRERAKEGTV